MMESSKKFEEEHDFVSSSETGAKTGSQQKKGAHGENKKTGVDILQYYAKRKSGSPRNKIPVADVADTTTFLSNSENKLKENTVANTSERNYGTDINKASSCGVVFNASINPQHYEKIYSKEYSSGMKQGIVALDNVFQESNLILDKEVKNETENVDINQTLKLDIKKKCDSFSDTTQYKSEHLPLMKEKTQVEALHPEQGKTHAGSQNSTSHANSQNTAYHTGSPKSTCHTDSQKSTTHPGSPNISSLPRIYMPSRYVLSPLGQQSIPQYYYGTPQNIQQYYAQSRLLALPQNYLGMQPRIVQPTIQSIPTQLLQQFPLNSSSVQTSKRYDLQCASDKNHLIRSYADSLSQNQPFDHKNLIAKNQLNVKDDNLKLEYSDNVLDEHTDVTEVLTSDEKTREMPHTETCSDDHSHTGMDSEIKKHIRELSSSDSESNDLSFSRENKHVPSLCPEKGQTCTGSQNSIFHTSQTSACRADSQKSKTDPNSTNTSSLPGAYLPSGYMLSPLGPQSIQQYYLNTPQNIQQCYAQPNLLALPQNYLGMQPRIVQPTIQSIPTQISRQFPLENSQRCTTQPTIYQNNQGTYPQQACLNSASLETGKRCDLKGVSDKHHLVRAFGDSFSEEQTFDPEKANVNEKIQSGVKDGHLKVEYSDKALDKHTDVNEANMRIESKPNEEMSLQFLNDNNTGKMSLEDIKSANHSGTLKCTEIKKDIRELLSSDSESEEKKHVQSLCPEQPKMLTNTGSPNFIHQKSTSHTSNQNTSSLYGVYMPSGYVMSPLGQQSTQQYHLSTPQKLEQYKMQHEIVSSPQNNQGLQATVQTQISQHINSVNAQRYVMQPTVSGTYQNKAYSYPQQANLNSAASQLLLNSTGTPYIYDSRVMVPSLHSNLINPHMYAYLQQQNILHNMQMQQYHQATSLSISNASGKSQNKPKFQFENYWSREGVQAGLKRGLLIQGAIRINARNYEDSYVPHPDGKSDIYICGQKNRNRALNGDIVAVSIFPREEWKVMVDDLEHAAEDLETHFAGLNLNETSAMPDINTDEEDSPDVIVEEEYEEMLNSIKNELKNTKDSSDERKIDPREQQRKNSKSDESKYLSSQNKVDKFSAENKQKTDSGKNQHESSQKTPRKAFIMLQDLGTEQHTCSPKVKKLFSEENNDAGDRASVKQRLDALPSNLLLRTGKVVYIIEKKHSRACTGHLKIMQNKNPNTALFSPTDHRLPRLLVPMSDCPQGFYDRPEDHANTLFVARITDWEGTGNMATGQLARSLGEAGQIEPETEGILMECDVDYSEFPQQAIDCLPQASFDNPWTIPVEEFGKRRDFRKECVFTIDPATARDLDDALHVIDLGNGEYEVGVHIADVSYFVTPNTALDDVAASRTTSVYLVQKVIPMLPRLLCEQLCSLNPDEDRLTFSVVWKMTETGEILDEWFGRSVIRSCAKLSYNHAQGFLEEPDRTWGPDELPPISKGFDSDQIKKKVLILDKIAKNLRQNRYDLGALSLNQVKMQFTLDRETGMPCGYSVYKQRDSNKLIEEFMLLANMAVAHKIYTTFPQVAVLRRHPEPQTRLIDGQVAMLKTMGVDIDSSSSKTLQTSLLDFFGDNLEKRAHFNILTLLFAKTMQLAKYFCTGCVEDDDFYKHYALCVPLYTHFTSPIRRYPDIMVHRLLGAALGCNELPSLDKDEVMSQCQLCNDKRINAKVAQELSGEMFFAVFVKDCGPLEEKGVVVKTYDKSFDVLFLNLGVVKRIYLERLPLVSTHFNTDKLACELTLNWKANDSHPKVVAQKLTIFTPVNCLLVAEEGNLKWAALLKHPDDPLVNQEIKSRLPENIFTPDMKISYEDI